MPSLLASSPSLLTDFGHRVAILWINCYAALIGIAAFMGAMNTYRQITQSVMVLAAVALISLYISTMSMELKDRSPHLKWTFPLFAEMAAHRTTTGLLLHLPLVLMGCPLLDHATALLASA